MLAMMTSACLAAAAMTAQPALDEPAQIMVEFRLLEADLTTGNTWVTDPFEEKPKPSIRFEKDGSLELGASGLRFTSMSSSNWHFTLTDAGTIDVAGWRYVIGGPNEGLDESPFSVLSAPRVLVLDGQEAMVSIGQAVEYLEPAGEEGLFRVVTSEDASEGVSFTVTPKLRTDYSVLMDPIEFEFKEIAERERVDGLNMKHVGKPVMRTVTQRASVIVGPDETVLIPVMHSDFTERPLLLLVRPRVMLDAPEPQDATGQNENTPEESGASEEESGSPE